MRRVHDTKVKSLKMFNKYKYIFVIVIYLIMYIFKLCPSQIIFLFYTKYYCLHFVCLKHLTILLGILCNVSYKLKNKVLFLKKIKYLNSCIMI